MNIFNVLALLGGLAMFLFGMSVMGDALVKSTGNKLKSILSKLTSSKFKSFLVGLAVTAVIQSSSATTVMVVGFVNSGILTLGQSVGVIMGANLGTSVTSWLLSLTGISGDSFFIQLCKPSTFTPILAIIGVAMQMFAKDSKKKDVGVIFLGFAVLMFGMEAMSDAVAPLAENEAFKQMMLLFSNPILGVLVGAILTMIIQSSSASVGILQSLSLSGTVSVGTAIPIIMGQNIGTCITALLSSVGTSKNAKRAAFIHLYFNVIGTIVVLSVYCGLNAIFQFSIVEQPITPLGIAFVHTLFNIITIAILMPISGVLEKLANLTVRSGKNEGNAHMLDERFMNTPSVAVEQARNVANEMASTTRDSILSSFTLFDKFDSTVAANIREEEASVDKYEDVLGDYLVKLSSHDMSLSDSREVSKLLHIIGDLERISDHAVNMVEAAEEIHDNHLSFSADATQELSVMMGALSEILQLAIKALTDNDLTAAAKVEPLEQVVDSLRDTIKKNHIARLQNSECTIELGFVLSDILTNLERVSDHCSNIAGCIIEIANDSFEMHEYTNNVKLDSREYDELYAEYKLKYSIKPSLVGQHVS